MKLILFIIIIVIIVSVIIFLMNLLIDAFFNIKTLIKTNDLFDDTENQHGLIFNPKTKQLEADQSVITLF